MQLNYHNPSWLDVALVVVFLALGTVGILSIPTDLPGRIFLAVVSIAGWTWILTSLARMRTRQPPPRVMDDQPQWDAPPRESDS